MTGATIADTVPGLLSAQALRYGNAPAFIDTGQTSISYATLDREVARFGALLGQVGLGRKSRIAVVMPGGPETAVAMLATMSYAVSVPLDPSLDAAACSSLLAATRVEALLVAQGARATAISSAKSLGIPVVKRLHSLDEAGAMLVVDGDRQPAYRKPELPVAADVALLMHTSGTTGEPKIVPITHAQLLARARCNSLLDADRGICAAPLFTASAIEAGLLSTLIAGASVAFPVRADAERLVSEIALLEATYLWASPAVYAAIVGVVARRHCPTPSLRFLRGGSAALTAELQASLEAAFRVPVLQGYGMTETGVIARNGMSPGERRAGSVGKPMGNRVMIATADGAAMPQGETGEILVQGSGVIDGYEQPEANRLAFRDGWFRTGDLGYFDDAGFLHITGRAHETINRGGRQVSPFDIDRALAKHPAVLAAAGFAVPHPTLGEDIAAAVVLREAGAATARDLRAFAFDHLAPFKVPSIVVVVEHLPTNALGKVHRKALAETLRFTLRSDFVSPRDEDEVRIARVFAEVLGRERVGSLDNFFELGGDSLSGARVVGSINAEYGIELPAEALFMMPTVAELAASLAAARMSSAPTEVRAQPR